jgi:hypothetical protein
MKKKVQSSVAVGRNDNYDLKKKYSRLHASDLREIVRFLREIEFIEFECNAFVLVLVQIDLIHSEHTKCISSTSFKTNTNPLHLRSIHTISCKIGHVKQIVPHQFVLKMISIFNLYLVNLNKN